MKQEEPAIPPVDMDEVTRLVHLAWMNPEPSAKSEDRQQKPA